MSDARADTAPAVNAPQGRATDFERESELLPRDLPPAAIRVLAMFLVAAVAIATLVAIFVPLPETVTCGFVLAPEAGADPVKAPIGGSIDRVAVNDGQEVKSGDVLYSIKSEERGVLAERVKRLEAELAANKPLDVAVKDRNKSALRAADVRAKSLGSEIQFARQRKEVAAKLLSIAEQSFAGKLISEAEVLAARQADADAGQSLERLRREAEDARATLADMSATQNTQDKERNVAGARLDGELAEARAALAQNAGSAGEKSKDQTLFQVVAPYDGVVTGMGPRRAGAVIERGEVLCKVARAGARLRAELNVPELEVGKVAKGQRVKLLLDAYPYTRFGTKSATVAWVSPTTTEGFVRSFASLIDHSVVVDGTERPFRAGMSGKAHVITGSRTLAEYAFEPLRQLRENIKKDR